MQSTNPEIPNRFAVNYCRFSAKAAVSRNRSEEFNFSGRRYGISKKKLESVPASELFLQRLFLITLGHQLQLSVRLRRLAALLGRADAK